VSASDFAEQMLEVTSLRNQLNDIRVTSVLREFGAIDPDNEENTEIRWSYLLRCASALALGASEAAQDAALRIAQLCLSSAGSEEVEEGHLVAAALVLEWLGNRRALALADARELVPTEAWTSAPAPLRADVMRRRLELLIPGAGNASLSVNPFQRAFWSVAQEGDWVSVSAQTSAGKSFIVNRWLVKRLSESEHFRGVYVVPTRALLDEVSKDLEKTFGREVPVFGIPWDSDIGKAPKELYVFTQERFHLLQNERTDFITDVLFVDEAQKLSDGERGVLLQRVIAEAVRREPAMQVIYASALAENPDLLLEGRPANSRGEALRSEVVTVNQNLLWVEEVQGEAKRFTVDLLVEGEPQRLGELALSSRATGGKRLPLIAHALGREHAGNLVYVNTAHEAEQVAIQLKAAREDEVDLSSEERVVRLKDLVEKTIHPRYRLNAALDAGIAFHYGNMPLLVRAEIEALFRDGVLSYLICTSTLLEGVNLPCSNLFVRGPKKGQRTYMSAADFWNLAGRAGRWGIEFQGNVVCIDATDESRWPEPPRKRVVRPLRRATDLVLADLPRLRAYIEGEDYEDSDQEKAPLEPVYNLLASRVVRGEGLVTLPGTAALGDENIADLEERIGRSLEEVEIHPEIYRRHSAISPRSMQALLEYFRGHPEPQRLPLAPPENRKAADNYVQALSRVARYLGAPFGSHPGYRYALAILMRDWMRGRPLPVLIKGRIKYERSANPGRSEDTLVAAAIRNTMRDVEQFARFEAPKYLSCYLDVLLQFLEDSEAEVRLPEMDLQMMLEMGVSRPTELSMMTLGLSRSSAVALEPNILDDNLDREGALAWLRDADLGEYDLPALVVAEIESALARNEDKDDIQAG
jgi:hypothetical protein